MSRNNGDEPPDPADVLIVGAGASGAVAANLLARRGVRVVCLEQGDWVLRSAYTGASPEWELSTTKVWSANPNVRRSPSDYPVDTSESPIDPLMYNAVGGSTIMYAAQWARFAPSDFRVKTLDGVADDWPISYSDLERFYGRVEKDLGISGLAGDPAYPEIESYPLPPLPLGRIGERIIEGFDRLGWHWWPGTNAIASRKYRDLASCIRRGTCMTGCPEGAKASFDVTHWPAALDAGARLVTGARVQEITVDERGLATGAAYTDRKGRVIHQEASIVIMAANGIGTPRLLMLSQSKRFPNGLANSSGVLGRNLMMHPGASVVGIYEDDFESWLGPAGQAVQSMQFYESDQHRGFCRGAKWDVMPTGGPLGLAMTSDFTPFESNWGETFHRRVKKMLGHSIEVNVTPEDLPSEENCVILDSELVDSDGIPAPKVIYSIADNTARMLTWHLDRVKELHEAAGCSSTLVKPLIRESGWHLLGTARMGLDPATSVVDPWCRSHDVPNLFIIDGSVFVTSSGVNPVATITAIASRCVENILATRADQPVPL